MLFKTKMILPFIIHTDDYQFSIIYEGIWVGWLSIIVTSVYSFNVLNMELE